MKTEWNWTTVGAPVVPESARDRFRRVAERAEWLAVPCTLSLSAGMALDAAIKELRLPKVSHVVEMPDLAPYGLVGARCHYRNGDADVWICDRGSDLLPIVSVFTPKEG